MSNISSNCLFHFTPKAEYLIGILTNNFQPRYCYEPNILKALKSAPSEVNWEGAVPMVCFCDISLGQIMSHVKTYGNYGIGMKKEWAARQMLNPVIYLTEDSIVTKSLGEIANSIKSILILNKDLKKRNPDYMPPTVDLTTSFLNYINFLKPYSGNFKRGSKIIKEVKFYNEREWRFVPLLLGHETISGILNKDKFENQITIAQENAKIKDFSLNFEPNDIKYLFVKEENEIQPLIKALREIKQSKYSSEEIDLLTSKILTTDQIEEDF